MSITISIYLAGVIVFVALMGGFWLGRSVKWMTVDADSRVDEKEAVKRISAGWEICSPATGIVCGLDEGIGRGVLIQPERGAVYAPASGKITKLYPMGNAMLLQMDSGVELLLRAGETKDELHNVYYRLHVIQNEIVSKGKLLLEYDVEGLQKEGVDTAIVVALETNRNYEIAVARRERVKAGEELLRIYEPALTV